MTTKKELEQEINFVKTNNIVLQKRIDALEKIVKELKKSVKTRDVKE